MPVLLPNSPAGGLSRRRLLVGGASAALLTLTGCGSDAGSGSGQSGSGSGQTENAASNGPWEFTDDRAKKATRDSRPTKIVAQLSAAAALWDLGIRPIGTFGEAPADGAKSPLAGNVDTGSLTWVGKTWGEFNIEKFASLNPELLIAPMQQKSGLWYVPEEAASKIEALAPTVGISHVEVPADKVIDRYAELAKSLGADLESAAVTSAKKDFQAAAAAVSDAVKAKPGLRVAFVSGAKENLYIANATMFSDLYYLKNLGVNFVTPKPPADEPHWEVLSWEQADKYPADVILYDSRNASFFTTDLAKFPTFGRLPAVKANQLFSWNPETPTSWLAFAPLLSGFATHLTSARPLTTS
jgi:iron complex transport system substrate-binding protein